MDFQSAASAVEDDRLKAVLKVGLHLEEFQPEHLRLDGHLMRVSTRGRRFVDERVRLCGLIGHLLDGPLK